MTGIKKDPNRTHTNWGGARKGAGRKLKRTSEFSDIFSHLRDKYNLDPVETHFMILDVLKDDDTLNGIKYKQLSANKLIDKMYPNPTETFEDEEGNTVLSNQQLDAEIAALMAELGGKE